MPLSLSSRQSAACPERPPRDPEARRIRGDAEELGLADTELRGNQLRAKLDAAAPRREDRAVPRNWSAVDPASGRQSPEQQSQQPQSAPPNPKAAVLGGEEINLTRITKMSASR
jgi:hypothetical protein